MLFVPLSLHAQTFTEVGASAGVVLAGNGKAGVWGDYDNDGDLDLYVDNDNQPNRLYRNNGDGTFTDVAASAGVNDNGIGRDVAWGDYDNDGDLDLYMSKNVANILYRNNGNGTFSSVGAAAGVNDSGDGRGVGWADYDNDGDLDLYLGNNGTNRLFRNNGNGAFTEVGATAGVDDTGTGVAPVWGDYDNDGDLDLYLPKNGNPNRLYRNNGNGSFTDVGGAAGVDDAGAGAGAAWGDYDNDGDLDLYLVNQNSANRLYRNNGNGSFTDVGGTAGVDDAGAGTGVGWADYDSDGDLDLYLVNQNSANRLYRNNGNGTFAEVGGDAGVANVGNGAAASWADYDSDGDLDLSLMNNANQANRLYRNNGNANRWLIVKLTGVTSNRNGIGARITAVTGALRQRRDVEGGGRSQPSLPVEFGFGATATVDSLIVRWPSGHENFLTSVATHQTLAVTELGTVTLSSPADAAVTQPFPATLSWNTVSGATSYRLQVSTASSFGATVLDTTLSGTSKSVYGLAGLSVYYWRVRALNGSLAGQFSAARSFTTGLFTEVGASAGVADAGWGQGVAWGDYDNDGDLDLYLANAGSANRLYRNNNDGTFTEVGASAGVNDTNGRGAAWGDYDNDGDLDLYLAKPGSANRLYRNNGNGTFTEVGSSAGVDDTGSGQAAAWADYDGDGDLDLYLANYGQANRLYRNEGNGTFAEVGASAGVDDAGNGYAVAWGDYDDDGDPDLYLSGNNTASRLYRNNGNGTFTDVSASAGVAVPGSSGTGAAWADYDNDGDLDLFAAFILANRLYRNNGNGTFTNVLDSAGVIYSGTVRGVSWGDYDNDGDLDLYLANYLYSTYPSANWLYRNNGNGTFTEVGASAGVNDAGNGWGTAWGDYDNDGDLDLYLANNDAQTNRLFRNNGNTNQWLIVKLVGTISNRNGIGARVTAVAGSTRQRRDVDGGSGFQSQPSLPVEFGFGSTTAVDSLIVKWPSGAVSTLTGVATNQTLTVTEPRAQMSVTSLAFGSVEKGASSNQTFTVTHTGGGTLSIGSVTSSNPQFTVSPTTFSLTASASQTVTVTFSPTFVGAQGGTLSLAHNGQGGASSVTVSGTGIDTTPPAVPSGLTATVGNNQVSLSWTANVESDVSHYVLYRSATSGFTPTSADSVARVNHPGMVFLNDGLSAGTYYFKIVAADSSGNRSGGSAQASATLASGISLSSSSLSFGSVSIGSSGLMTLSVSSVGTDTLRVSGITLSGADAAQFSVSPATLTIPPGTAAQSVTVTFTPTGYAGNRAASLSVAHNASGSPATVTLSGTATGTSGIALSASSLAFGSVLVGGTPETQTFTVSNTGTDTLRVSSFARAGVDSAQFSVSPATLTIPPGTPAQSVTVTFAPVGGPGSRSAGLSLVYNGAGSPASVSLAGTALAPTISLPQTSLAFGDVSVGKSAALNLSVQNIGTANLLISGVTVTGADASQFQVTVTAQTVGPGQTAVVSVVAFSPTLSGTKSATLSIAHNATGTPSAVALSGSALPGRIQVFTTALNFGEVEVGKRKDLFLSITNAGTGPLAIGSITSDTKGFTVSDSAFTISPGGGKDISITFAPTVEGAQSGSLTISSNDPDRPTLLVSISGAGFVIRPRIAVSPASLSFDTVLVGQKKTLTLTVSNGGRAPLNVREVKVSAPPFSAVSDTFRLDQNSRRDVGVTFQPTGEGVFSAVLTIRSDDATQPEVGVSLAGVSRVPPPEVDIEATDAAGQPLTTGRAPLTVRFVAINTGGPATRYVWNFGDGSPSGEGRDSTVVYTYTVPGVFTVTLNVSGPGGGVTRTKERFLVVRPAVEAHFGASPTSGRAPLTVVFTDSSSGQVLSRRWEFGDGDTSSAQSPTHIYRTPGLFGVRLTVTGQGGATDTRTRDSLIAIPPVADFSARPISGLDTLTVAFADSSQGATGWRWEFGDGDTSAVRSPTHLYRAPGVYTVRLRVIGPGGADVKERKDFIAVRERIRADFGATPISGRAPLRVAFSDSSRGGITSYLWSFGDGDTSTVRNPAHTYTRVDSFTVSLSVTGPAGSDTKTVQGLIVVVPNRPPALPIPHTPADSAVGVPLTPRLAWARSPDPEGDPVVYDVFLGADRVKSTPDTFLVVGPLSEATDYAWRVTARDSQGGVMEGPTGRFRTVGDTQAPLVIEGPVVEAVTQNAATLLWTTDEPGRSQGEVRLRGGTAFTPTPQDTVLSRTHRVGVAGLASGLTYEYRVVSQDRAGNASTFPAASPYPTFTTLAARDTIPPQFTGPPSASFVSDSSATVVWSTDERSTSEAGFRLESDTAFVSASPGELGTEHRVVLNGLRPGTAYAVRVRSADASGNGAFGPVLRIVTASGITAPARMRLFNVSVVGRTESRAVIEWSTDRPATSLVRYGLNPILSPSLTQAGEDGVLEHRVTLTRLTPNTVYFYRVLSGASPADSSEVFSFKTHGVARTTPPVILEGPLAQGVGENRATVVWKTDEVSTGAVTFGASGAGFSSTVTASGSDRDHAVTLTGLAPGETYTYRVRSEGLTRVAVVSGEFRFTTLAARDTLPPTILEGPTVTVRSSGGFTVAWQTDEISTTEVALDSLNQTRTTPGLSQRHSIGVGDLRPATRYGFRVRSTDAAGNVRESAAFQVTTLADTLADRTPPRLVSPPAVASVTHQTATVVWGTDEPAGSLVEFGRSLEDLSEDQGEERVYVTDHRVVLTNLAPATTYHYRVSSTDAAGNGPTRNAGALDFTTRAAADTIPTRIVSGPTVVSVTDRTAAVEWTTDEPGDSRVNYASGVDTTPARLRQQAEASEGVTAHRVTLTNLTPDTTYAFLVSSQDLTHNARTFSTGRTFRTRAAPDTIPPDLVGVPSSVEVTSTTATLVWTTDEATNTTVEYGTTDYGGRVERGELGRSHTITLTGLLADTDYRYRVTSWDREGNGVTTDPTVTLPPARTRLRSSDLRFRTARVADTTPPVIVEGPSVSISGNNVVVRWVTDELSNSRVVYARPQDFGRPALEQETFGGSLVTVHLMTLAGLDLNTQYFFRCVSADATGNTVVSGRGRGSGKPVEGQALQPPGGDGSFVTAPQADQRPPVILSGPTVAGATSGSLTIEWSTDEASDSFVEYGPGERPSSRTEDGAPVTRHRVVLSKLTPGTLYSFVAGSADPSRNGPTQSRLTVGTTLPEVDVTPPRTVGGPAISYKSDRQAVITWLTDEASSSLAEYGTGTEAPQVRSIPDPVKEHRVTLTNLSPATTYTIRGGAVDLANNGPAWTTPVTLTTDPAPDTRPPRIVEGPAVQAVTDASATVTWRTDELSDSGVRFGLSSASLGFSAGTSDGVTAHRVILTGLAASTTYHLRVSSVDRAGNGPAVSPEGGRTVSFTTAAGRDTLPPSGIPAVLGLTGSRVVVLSWPSSTEPDLAGYHVYRGTGAEALRRVASNLTEARFRDEGVTDETTYRYVVTVLDRAGNESQRSTEVALTPSQRHAPTAPRFRGVQGKPLTPTFVVENASSPRGLLLTYTFQVSARPDFTDVAASAVGVEQGHEAFEAGLTAWTVSRDLTEGGTYYFRARASDSVFEGPFTPVVAYRADAAVMRPGDFNGDFTVDFEDFFLFAQAFGSRVSGEDAKFDLVADGHVGFEDFFTFAGLFGKRYTR